MAGHNGHGGRVFEAAQLLGTDYRELLDFSANLNPFGCPSSVQAAMQEGLSRAAFYPDPSQRALRAAIAEAEQVSPAWVMAGAGAADVIFRLCYGLRPARGLVCAPSFLEYGRALTAAGAKILYAAAEETPVKVTDAVGQMAAGNQEKFSGKRIVLDDRKSSRTDKDCAYRLRKSRLFDELQSGDVAFLCNPNNPTGLFVEPDWGLAFLAKCRERGITVVMDECFLDFTGQEKARSWEPFLNEYPNLVLLKSFTKLFAMPGIRLGYLLTANEALIRRAEQAGQAWGMSCVAESAGIAAAKAHDDWAARTSRAIRPLREELKKGLEALGFSVKNGQANFLCFHAPGYPDLEQRLLQKQILLRSCGNYEGLGPEDYRTAVRTDTENARLLQALKEITGEEHR